jgi:outer membrane biogenesis lipoprotein LolB
MPLPLRHLAAVAAAATLLLAGCSFDGDSSSSAGGTDVTVAPA